MLYLHIPFCKQKCSYCNFHFSTSLNLKDDMVEMMCREIDLRHSELQDKTLKSLYFGGGTPSILTYDDLAKLFNKILSHFSFDNQIEITLEANPDNLSDAFLKDLIKLGVNRLSIGTQSFFEEDLKLMNRAHTASEAESSIKRSQDAGIENISIDLIYGSPTSGFSIWKENLNKTIELEIPHVSSYALTVEPKTALNAWIKNGDVSAPKESDQSKEFIYLSDFLKDNGFEHYEISNFAKPGFRSKHNAAYWQYKPYLGIGPSAHSYDGFNQRSWNIANNSQYIKALKEKKLAAEVEILSEKEKFNELIMIGLRTVWGADLNKIKNEFNEEIQVHLQKEIQPKLEAGLLVVDDHSLKIPGKHWFLADGIAADLFMV